MQEINTSELIRVLVDKREFCKPHVVCNLWGGLFVSNENEPEHNKDGSGIKFRADLYQCLRDLRRLGFSVMLSDPANEGRDFELTKGFASKMMARRCRDYEIPYSPGIRVFPEHRFEQMPIGVLIDGNPPQVLKDNSYLVLEPDDPALNEFLQRYAVLNQNPELLPDIG